MTHDLLIFLWLLFLVGTSLGWEDDLPSDARVFSVTSFEA